MHLVARELQHDSLGCVYFCSRPLHVIVFCSPYNAGANAAIDVSGRDAALATALLPSPPLRVEPLASQPAKTLRLGCEVAAILAGQDVLS
jgi:hypothetical protein